MRVTVDEFRIESHQFEQFIYPFPFFLSSGDFVHFKGCGNY